MIKEYGFREEMYHFMIPKNRIGCEIGVCRGVNAVNLFQSTKPKILHLVDIWKDNQKPELQVQMHREDNYFKQVSLFFTQEIQNNRVKLHKMDSLKFLNSLQNEYLDWIYLDSCHFYKHIKQEIILSLKKVRKGGLIMGHDFHPGDPQRSGVIRAVIESCQDGLMEMIAISSERWASWICKVK